MQKSLIYLAVICILLSCSTIPFDKYSNYPILKLENLTSLDSKDINILLVNSKNELAKNSATLVKEILASQNHIKVIDREFSVNMSKERRIAELNNIKTDSSVKVADYIISIDCRANAIKTIDIPRGIYTVKEAAVIKTFNLINNIYIPSEDYTGKDGKTYTIIKATRYFSVKVKATINIYKFPSLEQVGILGNQYVGYSKVFSVRQDLSDSISSNLISKAMQQCIIGLKEPLLNKFPLRSYVIGMKYYAKKSKYIVQIDSGLLNNIKEGDELAFFKDKVSTHPITNKKTIDFVKLGEGKVSPFILQNSSWVYVDEKLAKKLKIGHWIVRFY